MWIGFHSILNSDYLLLCKHSALQNTDKTVHHLVFGPFNYAIISSFPEPGRRLVEISTVSTESTVISTVISTYNCNNCLYPAAAYVIRETGHPAPAAGTTLHIATVAYWRTIHNYSVVVSLVRPETRFTPGHGGDNGDIRGHVDTSGHRSIKCAISHNSANRD